MARIDDGHSTTIQLVSYPSVVFYEKSVTPPGLDGGDPNDTTTMRNKQLRTMAPRKLKTLTAVTAKVAYDPSILTADVDSLYKLINVNQVIVVNNSDGSRMAFWGYVRSFIPDDNVEGAQPTGTLTVQPTNQNATGVETPPAFYKVIGGVTQTVATFPVGTTPLPVYPVLPAAP